MGGWRGKVAGTAVLLALLLGLAALIAHAMFDSEHLKAMARERAQAAWARELSINTLSLRLFPVPALRATGLALSNPAWAHEAHLAEADALEVRLSWRALLSGRIAPGALRVEGGRLKLERGADGRGNWELEGSGERHDAMDWRQLVRVEAHDVELGYRNGVASPSAWRIPTLMASASPGWRDVRFHATAEHAQQTMTAEGRLADLSQAGVAGASTEGSIVAHSPWARLEFKGRLPLAASANAFLSSVVLEAKSATALLHFLNLGNGTGAAAPLSLRATLRGSDGGLLASALQLRLGRTEASGELRVRRENARLRIEGRLDSPDVDWALLTRDADRPPPPEAPEGELFRHHPLPWNALNALDGVDSALTLRLARLKLRSGIQLTDVQAEVRSHGKLMDIPSFSMKLLGGRASGRLRLDGARRSAQLKLDASGVLLERWFSERGRKVPVSGGPMQISAGVNGHGDSLREIAATLNGPINLRGGATLIRSAKAGEAESLLTNLFPLFSERDTQQVKLQCFAGQLPFAHGVAAALVGARSDASQLLTSGQVDLKSQSVTLRGRVRARDGISLGISTLSGDVSITGPLRHPKMALDPAGAPSALARLGAAVITGGLSIVATVAWDAANPRANPCQAVFRPRE